MKFEILPYRIILPAVIVIMLANAGLATAQQRPNNIFAITPDTIGGQYWNIFRLVSAGDGAPLQEIGAAPAPLKNMKAPLSGKVAASALDKANNRLFFSSMYTNQLYAVNVTQKNSQPYRVGSLQAPSAMPGDSEETNITRMVIGPHGNGYALTNDGHHLFVFTTKGPTIIKDLGSLKDAPGNGVNSVHAPRLSWGGDLIADKDGLLYLVNMYSQVFRIEVPKLEATYLGTIQGLPCGFYPNGVAVDEEGRVLLSCAIYTRGYFVLDMATLKATPLESSRQVVYNASDLASSNLLYEAGSKRAATATANTTTGTGNANSITIWPNPASGKTFNVAFNAMDAGDYTIQLVSMEGKVLLNKAVKVAGARQTVPVPYAAGIMSGMYIVKVLRSNTTCVSSRLFIL